MMLDPLGITRPVVVSRPVTESAILLLVKLFDFVEDGFHDGGYLREFGEWNTIDIDIPCGITIRPEGHIFV